MERGPKPRARGNLPIFARPTKRGWYWYCHVRTPDGRRPQRALHIRADDTKASWDAAVAAFWQEQARATAGQADRPKPKTTLAQALDALVRELETAGVTPHTMKGTLNSARILLEHFGPDHDAQAISRQLLAEFTAKEMTKRAAVSVDREISVVCRALEAVDIDPPRRPKLKREHKKQQPLTEAELRRFLMAARPQHKLPLLVYCLVGVRKSEYLHMSQVDWDKRLIHVEGTKVKRADRWVPIPDELWEHMQPLRKGWSGFPRFGEKRLYEIVVETAERAGLGHRHPNDLRGTWATQAALRGVSPAERAAIQGHSEAMQISRYSQPQTEPEALRGAVEGMARLTAQPSSCIIHGAANAGSTSILAEQNAPEPDSVRGITHKKH